MFLYETIERNTPQVVWLIRSRREPLPRLGSRPTPLMRPRYRSFLRLDGIPKAYILHPEKGVIYRSRYATGRLWSRW